MPDETYVDIKIVLLALPPSAQRATALALAELTIPFVDLASDGSATDRLASAFEAIRSATDLRTTDAARRTLYQSPWLNGAEEPGGLSWYASRARAAWIYAADAMSTAPGDGVVNTFLAVDDLFDQVDHELGNTGLESLLREGLAADGMPPSGLSNAVVSAASEIAARH